MNVWPLRWMTSAPSLTAPPTVSHENVGVDSRRRVPLTVHGLLIGLMNSGCPPVSGLTARYVPSRYSWPLSCRMLPSSSHVLLLVGSSRSALKVYGPIGSSPALSSTW